MPKNIVICCDGTSNAFDSDHTNVVRAYQCTVKADSSQVTYYDPGVGTMPEVGLRSWIAKKLSVVTGLTTGSGIFRNVEEAYTYLMGVYEDGDKVFLFGFSRGAFTVRALAGMLHAVGLLRPGTTNLIPYAMKYWRKAFGKRGSALAADFKATMSRACKSHFLGLWDTVSSVGWFNFFETFPYTWRNPSVKIVRHAVSIDERRCCFRHNLMARAKDCPEQDVQNVWFAGVHADVGGGYPRTESGLARFAFEWIIEEAELAGLLVDKGRKEQLLKEMLEQADVEQRTPTLHNSLVGLWLLLELLPRRQWNPARQEMGLSWGPARKRHVGTAAALHPSVRGRLEQVEAAYKPANIPVNPVYWGTPRTSDTAQHRDS